MMRAYGLALDPSLFMCVGFFGVGGFCGLFPFRLQLFDILAGARGRVDARSRDRPLHLGRWFTLSGD